MPAKLTRPENSFNNIYMRYYKKSFLFVKSYIHNEMVAEDIAGILILFSSLKRIKMHLNHSSNCGNGYRTTRWKILNRCCSVFCEIKP